MALRESITAIKEKASAALDVVRPAVQSASSRAIPVASSAVETVRRNSIAAAQVATEKYQESGLDVTFSNVNSKVNETAQKFASSGPVKSIEGVAKSKISFFQRNLSAGVDHLAASMKSPEFAPDASFEVLPSNPKALTLTALKFVSSHFIGCFERTTTISAIEGVFSASDRPAGRVCMWKYQEDGEIAQTVEIILNAGASCLEVGDDVISTIFIGRTDGAVQIYRFEHGSLTELHNLKIHSSTVFSIKHLQQWNTHAENTLSSRGVIITTSADSTVRIVDFESHKTLFHLELSAPCYTSAPISQECVFFGSMHGQLIAMDFTTTTPVTKVDLNSTHNGGGICGMTEDSSVIWTAGTDGVVSKWSASPLSVLESYYGHSCPVRHCIWCPDAGRDGLLITGDSKGYILVWPSENGNMHVSIHGHAKAITSLTWCKLTKRLFSGAEDGTCRIWDINRIMSGNRFSSAARQQSSTPLFSSSIHDHNAYHQDTSDDENSNANTTLTHSSTNAHSAEASHPSAPLEEQTEDVEPSND